MTTSDTDRSRERAGAELVRLDLEHEAVWLLGLVGGRFPDLEPRAREELGRHQRRRDDLVERLDDEGVDVAPPRAAYGVPPVDEAAAAAALADVERRLCAACLAVVPLLAPAERPGAVDDLAEAASAAARWGAEPVAFPGLD